MKHIPNIITSLRMVCTLFLLVVKPFSPLFFCLYSMAGVSDMLDGLAARKINADSPLGALLDSIADAMLIAVMLYRLPAYFEWPNWLTIWLMVIIGLRMTSLVIGLVRYHALAFRHTYANKATGLLLFLFPFSYGFLPVTVAALPLCIIATLSAVEELLLNCTSETLDRNRTCIFRKS